jgi:hypothetical protein
VKARHVEDINVEEARYEYVEDINAEKARLVEAETKRRLHLEDMFRNKEKARHVEDIKVKEVGHVAGINVEKARYVDINVEKAKCMEEKEQGESQACRGQKQREGHVCRE